MATVNKNFRIKDGLIVEGTTGTINGDNIVTENASQTLSSKEFNGETKFHAANGAGSLSINLDGTYGTTTITGNNGDLNLVTNNGNIVLNADNTVYLDSVYAGNEVVSKSYVDSNPGNFVDSTGATNAAAELLTGATLTNITITGDGSGLTITAENGVADSTTDDLEEGTTNLYFTDERAIAAVGGSATSNNTANTVVKRDGSGNFAAGQITANEIVVQTAGNIFEDSALNITSTTGNDINITATQDVNITSSYGDIVLNADGTIYRNSISAGNELIAQSNLDTYIGDNTVNGSTGNTIIDRINSAAGTAEDNANTYTDTALGSYTPTSSLDTTVGSYGYIKTADLSGLATETYVGTAVSNAVDNLVDGAPGLLDTLNELAAAINDDENYATTMTTALATKVNAVNPEFTIGSGPGTSLYTATGVDYISNYGSSMPNWYYIRPDATGMSGITALNLQQDNFSVIISGTGTQYDGTWKGYKAEDWAIRFYGPLGIASGYIFNSSFTFEIKEGIPAKTISSAELSLLDGLTSPLVTTVELATKQNTLTAGSNIDISGSTISVTGLDAADISDFNTAALSATASAYDTAGAAATAETNAKTYADDNFVTLDSLPGQLDDYVPTTEKGQALGVATLDADGYVPLTQLGNVPTAYITALDTAENNLSVTDGALFLTDTPTFTEVNFGSVSKQVAAVTSVATAGAAVAYAFAKADYRAAEFLVKVSYGSHTEVSKVILTLDTSDNIAITEYAVVGTNGSLSTITAGINGTNVELQLTTAHDSSTVVVSGTLLA